MNYELGCLLVLLLAIPGTSGESTVVPVVASSIVAVFLLAFVILLILALNYWRNKIEEIDGRRKIREEYRRIYSMQAASQQTIIQNEKMIPLSQAPSEYSFRSPREASIRSGPARHVSDFSDKADTWIVENKQPRYDTKEQTMQFDDEEDVVIVTDVIGGASPDPMSSGIPLSTISSSNRQTSTVMSSSAIPSSTIMSSSDRPTSTVIYSSARPTYTSMSSSTRPTSGEITVTTVTSSGDPLTQLSNRQRNLATIGNVDDADDVVVDFKRSDMGNTVLY